MSDRKEYIVGLAKGVDFENFNNEMIATTGQGVIPNRTVDVANQRPLSKRLTHYYLTEEEANDLINDPRVVCVEIPPEKRKDIFPIRDASQTSNFSKTTSDSGPYVNWGLRRSNEETNVYGNATIVSGDYNYTLNGSGVDVVIQDSGIEPNHPEWQDENGVSRLKQIDWFTASGITGTQSSNHYRDFDGHGTHCAGIAAGKTYGWAKGVRVYSLNVNAFSSSYWFDAIKEFHKAKAVDPVTGFKRPTIVNASWGYKSYFSSITNVYFRGTNTGTTAKNRDYGMIGDGSSRFNANLYSLNVEVEEMQDEGVHYFKSAGNQYQKLCYSTDVDYNNYITRSVNSGGITAGQPIYYNRGAGNIGPDTIVCGNLDSGLYSSGEATATSSDKEEELQTQFKAHSL